MATVKKSAAKKKPVSKSVVKAVKRTVKKPTTLKTKKVVLLKKIASFAVQDLVKYEVAILGLSYVAVARISGLTKDTVTLATLPFPQKGRVICNITVSLAEAKAAKMAKVTAVDLSKANMLGGPAYIGSPQSMMQLSTALS